MVVMVEVTIMVMMVAKVRCNGSGDKMVEAIMVMVVRQCSGGGRGGIVVVW